MTINNTKPPEEDRPSIAQVVFVWIRAIVKKNLRFGFDKKTEVRSFHA